MELQAPMWRMPTLGVTSEDFINQKNQSNPRAFYNRMWRYKRDQDHKDDLAKQVADRAAALESKRSEVPQPLDNYLVDEAKSLGLPISQPDTYATQPAKASRPAEPLKPYFTEASLRDVPKEQLVEMAAALGIANTALPKPKLIEAILDKQS